MTTAVQLFNFKSNQIRVLMIESDPWFVGSDILDLLFGGASGRGHLYDKLSADEGRKVNRIHLGMNPGKPMIVVSESGLYKLIMRSDSPKAKSFQDWVTKEVLPAIRKDGAYVMGEEKVATGEMSEDELIIKAMSILQRKVERITKERDAALAVIETQLKRQTVDEYFALKHLYATQSQRITLGKRASQICLRRNLQVAQQERKLPTLLGYRMVVINEYPVEALDAAFASMEAEGLI